MATNRRHTRLQYLHRASEMLQTSSPPISAFLQSTRSKEASEVGEVPPPDERSRACNACGTLLVIGWSCSTDRRRPGALSRTQRSRTKRPHAVQTKDVKLRCSVCNATTVVSSEKPPKACRHSSSKVQVEPPQTVTESVPTASGAYDKASTQAANRKARTKKSNLQAMLASQRAAGSGSNKPGLNLMDFMKG